MEVGLLCPKTGKTSTEPISADFLNIAKFPFLAHILQQNFKFESKNLCFFTSNSWKFKIKSWCWTNICKI